MRSEPVFFEDDDVIPGGQSFKLSARYFEARPQSGAREDVQDGSDVAFTERLSVASFPA